MASKAKTGGATSTNGTSKPKQANKSTPSQTITSTTEETDVATSSGKPDKAAYDAEQDKYKKDIEVLQTKVNAVKEKIGLTGKSNPTNDKRAELRAELDDIRSKQSGNKSSRSNTLDRLKSIQEGIKKKTEELNAAKGKLSFKSVADVDSHIKDLEKKVESGSLKIADEKRALQEITQSKRARKTIENFQGEQASIDADRAAADELRKQLDDPVSKALSERFDAIKTELDALKQESDAAYAGRNKLFEERDSLQAQITELYDGKRASTAKYREAGDKYWAKVNEDRARRAERAKAERAQQDSAKKLEVAQRLREEASVPAYQFQIEDCQTLIDYFTGKKDATVLKSIDAPKSDLAGVAPLELRKVEADANMVVRKKKGEDTDSENYFVSSGKGKKGGKKGNASKEPAESAASGALNVPLATLSALLSMSITPPASQSDVPRVVEDLQTKKDWYEANNAKQTRDNIAKAEANIAKLTSKGEEGANGDATTSTKVDETISTTAE